jgi:methylmalonyl-CoA mutase N-terminal domain/subunit
MRPDFSKIKNISVKKEESHDTPESVWLTAEQIGVRPKFSLKDLKNMEQSELMQAGIPPFLRGPIFHHVLSSQHTWTIRQYPDFRQLNDSNAFYRRNSRSRIQMGLSVAFGYEYLLTGLRFRP